MDVKNDGTDPVTDAVVYVTPLTPGVTMLDDTATVGNLAVLNPTVVHPASGILWHSTTMQPHAPFGEYLPFSPIGEAPDAPVLPADPGFAAGRLREEAEEVNEARRAAELADAGYFAEAAGLLDRLARLPDGHLDPARLAWARARGRWSQGQLDVAYQILGELEALNAPFDIRAHGLTMRAILADRLERRDEALRLYGMARSHLAKRPEFNVFADLHERVGSLLVDACHPGCNRGWCYEEGIGRLLCGPCSGSAEFENGRTLGRHIVWSLLRIDAVHARVFDADFLREQCLSIRNIPFAVAA